MDRAIEVLNFYRNRHYNEPDGTEEKELADAINEILPHYAALREQEQREQGCEWCQDEIMFDGEDMELVLRHPLEDAERAVYPNFCPMCGRKLGGAEDARG